MNHKAGDKMYFDYAGYCSKKIATVPTQTLEISNTGLPAHYTVIFFIFGLVYGASLWFWHYRSLPVDSLKIAQLCSAHLEIQILLSFIMYFNKKILLLLIFFYTHLVSIADSDNINKKKCDSLIKAGVELLLQKKNLSSLELLLKARSIASTNKWHKQSFAAINNIGNNYYMLLDYGEALKYYLESYKIATAHLGDREKMIVLNNIAILYSKDKKFDKANSNFSEAFEIAKKHDDSLKMGIYSINLGLLANEEGKLKEARMFFNRSLTCSNQDKVKIPAKIGLYHNQLLSGNAKLALANAKILLKNLSKEANADNRIDLSIIIARSHLRENQLSEALQWTNATFGEMPDLERKIELYDLLSEIYFRLQSYGIAFQYKDSVFTANTRLNDVKNSKLFESSEVKLQIQNYKLKIVEKEKRIQTERNFFYSILAVIILATTTLILIFRNYIVKSRQKEVKAKRAQEVTTIRLANKKMENALLIEKEKTALLEQERLQHEIQLNNQRLLSRALYSSGRNELLQDMIASFSEIDKVQGHHGLSKNIQELKQHIKMDDDWVNYVRHFEEVNQGFIKRLTLRHPDLTTNDIRYISYLYINLDTKEIASLLNITVVACRKRKERIEKRLNLPEHTTLNYYLLSI